MARKRGRAFAKETYGTSLQRTYIWDINEEKVEISTSKTIAWTSLANFFMTVFLPHGYPGSVSKDYFNYQLWDSIQAFASSITGSIANHAVLKGVGVGDESASVLAATMTMIIKDGTSMLGRIMFSWLHGTDLDSNCKQWRLFADILNDIAIFFDLICPYFKGYFTIIACISGVMRAVVGVAGGATRAALTQHQARKNNMADVSAKDGSQETLVNLTALACSTVIIPFVVQHHLFIWFTYFFMTFVHLAANYLAVKSVTMETFNVSRFNIYVDHYIKSSMRSFLSIAEVNKKESVFLLPLKKHVTIKLGTSFSQVIENKSARQIDVLLNLYEESDYFLTFSELSNKEGKIDICFRASATSATQMEAMYQACIVQNMLRTSRYKRSFLWNLYSIENFANEMFDSELPLVEFSRKLTIETFPVFKQRTEMYGWRTDIVMFNVDLWHVMW